MKAMNKELGGYMSNKEELLEAIEHYDIFTKAQRKILKSLVEVEIDGKSTVSVKTLAKAAKVSSSSVYQTINLFEKDNILSVVPSSNNKVNSFLLKKARLEEIKNISFKTQKLQNN